MKHMFHSLRCGITFEIKRSRLPASTSSTFQRYVVPADPSTARKIPTGLATNIASASLAGSLPSQRILPSLSQRMTWLEESVPAAPEAAEAIHVSERDQSDDSMPNADVDEPSIMETPGPSNAAVNGSGPRRRIRNVGRTAADLPRTERWKRRLPQAAW